VSCWVRLMCVLILYIMMDQNWLLKYMIITKMRKWEMSFSD